MRENNAPKAIHLKDYQPPEYLIETVQLHFDIRDGVTRVRSTLALIRNPYYNAQPNPPLVLVGLQLQLRALSLNGEVLPAERYQIEGDSLTIHSLPTQFQLEIETEIQPEQNTALEGLYLSNGMYCTQCEAEGFRRITYYLDRPDVMAKFTTTIEADKTRYPVLLSNGNPIARGDTSEGRHWVTWQDPFKKPCYLFAMVAGNLAHVEDHFTTVSGRKIVLQIYVEPQDLDKCAHAMNSLQKAMRWDEVVYGREYDLDIFMIVAVSHFNMGAMENKGLNVFNTSAVLANPLTTTDAGFKRVEAIIAHEYFHNWSGNRVTCRDWFQLSLKEGFTVFRDQQFSADMGSAVVQRVEDVGVLRTAQFAEDAGPMAHPVRPDSYIEINNFYTVTVYEKGAEVVRMIHTLVGEEGFRKGCDLYFERHDGQAVTTEDFVAAMEDANGLDLRQLKAWYDQAGTPQVVARDHYDAATQTYELHLTQTCPPTPQQPTKRPFLIPMRVGLLDQQGNDLPLRLKGHLSAPGKSVVLALTEMEQTFQFESIPCPPIPSLLRGFSAPVKLHYPYRPEQLAFLMSHDSDGFSRWDAGYRLATQVLLDLVAKISAGQPYELAPELIAAFDKVLHSATLDAAAKAMMLELPGEAYLSEQATPVAVDAIHQARRFARHTLATQFRTSFERLYGELSGKLAGQPYQPEQHQIAMRQLKNSCLGYLMMLEDDAAIQLAQRQFYAANNMSDQNSALRAAVHSQRAERTELLEAFYRQWRHEPLVVDQWFSVQATAPHPATLEAVQQLMHHGAFEITNPNKVRALIGAFANQNPLHFHRRDGAGYRFLTDQVIVLNRLNPLIAARMLTPMTRWRKYDSPRQSLLTDQLKRLLAEPNLSPDVYEIVSKSLQ